MGPYVIEKNSVYDLKTKLLSDRIVFIDGAVDDDLATTVVAQLLYLESVDNDADICMYINSPGGSIYSMFAIFDTMSYIKPDVMTVGIGCVASAASFILAAGAKGKRFVLPNTRVMIHQPSGGAHGQVSDIAITYKEIDYLKRRAVDYYAKFTGKDVSVLESDMDRDFYMSAEQAVEYGLVDSVEYVRRVQE